jgi:tetratricopeptide (TPR) repeat protein
MGIVAVLVARDAVVTTRYAVAWTSHRTLWARVVDSQPDEHLGYKLLGMDARVRGDTARALALLGRALAMAPSDRQIRFEYGQALYSAQRFRPAAQALAPLMRDTDAQAARELVALYLDAVGRSAGAAAVAREATPLLHGGAASTAALYLGIAQLQLGDRSAADSAFSVGLRRAPSDTALAARRDALRAAAGRH